jgi:hypothetical protein
MSQILSRTQFRIYCAQHKLDERAELTLDGAHRFTAWYSRRRHRNLLHPGNARTALHSLLCRRFPASSRVVRFEFLQHFVQQR